MNQNIELLYFTHDNCSVCKALFPKIQDLARKNQSISLVRVDIGRQEIGNLA